MVALGFCKDPISRIHEQVQQEKNIVVFWSSVRTFLDSIVLKLFDCHTFGKKSHVIAKESLKMKKVIG